MKYPPMVSLYQGPQARDGHSFKGSPAGGIECEHGSTYCGTGLYGLDAEGRVWILAAHECTAKLRWMYLDDFIKGPE